MIVVKGRKSDAEDEYSAANSLKQKILKKWPELNEHNNKDRVEIIVEPYLDAGSVKTADIVILADFEKPKEINFNFPLVKNKPKQRDEDENTEREIEFSTKKVFLKNFVCAVETKNHSKENIRYETGDLIVQTSGKWSNASAQNWKQHYALMDHIEKNTGIQPYVTKFVYLNRINEVPRMVSDVYCNNQSFLSILSGICNQMLRMGKLTKTDRGNNSAILQSVEDSRMEIILEKAFFTDLKPTQLDSKRMLQIARKVDKKWFEDIGSRMVIFSGLGGTGKTVRLLQIAHELYQDHGAKTVLFTYNWSLLANIRRLLQLMGIPEYKNDNSQKGAIRLESVMSFITKILIAFNFIKENESVLDVYQERVSEFEKYIHNEAITSDELREKMKELLWEKYDQAADFEYAFVDEGQDWFSGEKTILTALFGTQNLIIAHGHLQETRGEGIDWSNNLIRHKPDRVGDYAQHSLTAGVRMTPNLGEFVRSFAQKTLRDDQYSRLRINEMAEGGNIYIVEGDYFKNLELHNDIMSSISNIGVEPIDLLHCVVPEDVQRDGRVFRSKIGLKLNDLGFPTWDAVDDEKRKIMPKSQKDMRIVQYDSCRGLEGWITFLHDFDKFWDYKIEDVRDQRGQKKLFEDEEDFINEEVAKWALIALTRSISSTVIQINSKEHFIGRVLWELHQKNSDYIHWIKY